MSWFRSSWQKFRARIFKYPKAFPYLALLIPILLFFVVSKGVLAEPPVAASQASEEPSEPRKKNKYQRSKLTHDESEAVADRRQLLLTTGEDKVVDLDFDVPSANEIYFGNPQILMGTLVKAGDKRQIVFKPLKAGETTVTIRDKEGTIRIIFYVRVTGSNLDRIARELRSLLRDVEGIEIRIVGPKIVIEGEILIPLDYGRMLTVIQDKVYSEFIINLVTLSPLALQVVAKRIQDDVVSFAPNVKTRVVNGVIFLEGTVDSVDQARRANDVATYYLPDLRPGNPLETRDPGVKVLPRQLLKSFIVVNPPPPKKEEKHVRVTVHFVELSKDYIRFFGFKWQPGFTTDPQITIGQSQTGQTGASNAAGFTAVISSLVPKLDSAQNAGYARVLKTGTILTRSAVPAKLVENTDIPFPQQGQNGAITFASKTVGLTVSVTPTILGRSEDISMDLKLDQTSLTGKSAGGGPPITSVHKIETIIYVKSNESAAIGGVTSSDIGTDFNKDDPSPGTFESGSGTNALFSLLRTKSFHKKKSQFVIFVTPQIIENSSEGTEDLKKNFRVKVK